MVGAVFLRGYMQELKAGTYGQALFSPVAKLDVGLDLVQCISSYGSSFRKLM